MTTTPLLWQPSPERVAAANMTAFAARVAAATGRPLPDYATLWRWSIDDKEAFWRELWDYAGVVGERGATTLIDGERMPGARWFPDARLNFAENLLAGRAAEPEREALVFRGEDKVERAMTNGELLALVSRLAQALAAAGVGSGDRVAAYLPNMPEALVGMLAAVSRGAIWSSCSPDFGVQGVLDRFGQIEPKVLVTVDGYWYNGKALPIQDKVAAIAAALPTLERVVVVPYLQQTPGASDDLSAIRGGVSLEAFIAPHAPARSSTGACRSTIRSTSCIRRGRPACPKCIVHGAGGTLLQHLKEHLLHGDVKRGDRIFYFTTCGWMMWNWLVSGLATGATLLLYDGSPFVDARQAPCGTSPTRERMTHFGTSAKYIDAGEEDRPRPEQGLRAGRAAHDALDRLPAGAGELRLRLPSA